MAKILVIGGGVAGFTSALHLLRAGHQVTLAEKQKGKIDKVCGEGMLPFGVALLDELGLRDEVAAAGFPFRGLAYVLGAKQVSGSFEGDRMGIGIDRARLDALLRHACHEFPTFTLQAGRRILPGSDLPYAHILAADGINSRWAEAEGVAKKFGSRLGVRIRLQTPPPDHVRVHFFPTCEVYFTPTNDQTLSVAFLLDKDKMQIRGNQLWDWCVNHLNQYFPQYARTPILNIGTRGPIVSWPAGSHQPQIHLLGDAYRAFDPISGAGMSFALLCAKLATTHLHSPQDYYRALKPSICAINDFTNAVLFFRGAGFKTRLMLRQLDKAPETFRRMLTLHDGHHRFTDLGLRAMASFLRL